MDATKLEKLKKTIVALKESFGYDGRKKALAKAEATTEDPDFWKNPKEGKLFLQQIKREKEQIQAFQDLTKSWEDLLFFYDLYKEEGASENEVAMAEAHLHKHLESFRIQQTMTGAYDDEGAIIDINPGSGGVESQDWAAMLLRMYTMWAKRKGYVVETIHHQPAEEAGIKSATIKILGPYAYGLLRGEIGVHRLVRISPFDANSRRHTSFAAVDVCPAIEDKIEIEIQPSDLSWDTFRSQGAGGQNVNKVETGVRLHHIPSGIKVRCDKERTQLRNRQQALALLKLRLYQAEMARREKIKKDANKAKKGIVFGSQIRSYVLAPYQCVTDHRMGYKDERPQKILDGDLEALLNTFALFASRAENQT